MRKIIKAGMLAFAAACGAMLASSTSAEDIDIFVGSSAGSAASPNILIVLDNTSNWSRQSQKWPGGAAQGQAEVNAIKRVIQTVGANVNIGLMEFVTGGNANDDGGFIRYAINPMTADHKTAFSGHLTTIYNNINSPDEKRNSNTPYGNLMYDVYNYFSGGNSYSPNGVLASKADPNGYATTFTRFRSPLSADNSCANAFVIFISNPNSSGPAADTQANTNALAALGGSTTQIGLPEFREVTRTLPSTVGTTSQCYASKAACTPAEFAAQCSAFSEGCSCDAPVPSNTSASCPSGQQSYSVIKSTTTTTSTTTSGATITNYGLTSACYKNFNSASNAVSNRTDLGGMTCPGPTISGNSTTTYACSYEAANVTTHGSCENNSDRYRIVQHASPTTVTTTSSPGPQTNLGFTSQCYSSAASCSTADYSAQCSGTGVSCACGNPTESTTPSCPAGTSKYSVIGNDMVTTTEPTGNTSTDTGPRNADEWARFLYQRGVPVADSNRRSITTYTIDVYNAQQNGTHTSLMMSMAKAGGGKYFAAKNEDAIVDALKKILVEIQAVNTTFASTSLPVNATNRAQNENQVFIGMFRPDPDANPRWFGNMKRFQLIESGGNIELGDVAGNLAVNTNTGFLTACANSYWTTDSGNYWQNISINPSPAGTCDTTTFDKFSDAPDGPQVEKGAVAEVLRKGNNPSVTNGSPTWAVNRNIYTLSGTSLVDFTTGNTGLADNVVRFTRGEDVNNEKGSNSTTTTRPSIHGDVIHSRPLPVNYAPSGTRADGTPHPSQVVAYYGANDGTFRAVEADTGKEKWAFVAPEFFGSLSRLMTNSPMVRYPDQPIDIAPTPAPKNYFFDGSTGLYQNRDNTQVWIFPTMRRGGRMIYGLDVTDPNTPAFKWKVGCPNLNDDTGCTTGMAGIGQTWSAPNVAFIKGFSTTTPVIAVGGGYDACEDQNTATPACGSTKGNRIFILNADTGALLASFNTERSVAADISFVDIDGDSYPDYAYATDTGGNIYRVDFVNNPTNRTPLAPQSWTSRRVAYTGGGGRKFLFAPAVFANSKKVYLALGSGDREHPLRTDYPYSEVTNRFYVYVDDPSVTNVETNLDSLLDYTSNTSCSTTPVLPESTTKGWFMSLNQNGQGEQTVTSALIASGMVTFSTNRPVANANSCSASLGEARGYWVNLLNASGAIGVDGTCGGVRSSVFVGGGLPPSPVLATSVPIGGKATTVVIGAVQKGRTGTNVSISPQALKPIINSKRKRMYFYSKDER
ncbi:pilus assembly protein [Noviherbaspirillum aridicola]|uniref:PilY1 beta-propeller domain-containing protein n=1 Tax=Noviherbaspirillum aridicola TaxID=2849687 RepID=A0ABQ4Q9I8_9BURK|nr:PilC/PilY family type IV pilus protein [Noviherbaspirillum aridicola]GIZ53873.1 hypothetical protein NCCP691_38870 [Noviherbaspirillum aridicola]